MEARFLWKCNLPIKGDENIEVDQYYLQNNNKARIIYYLFKKWHLC